MAHKYNAYGSIELTAPSTLDDVEAFCKEARQLGVEGKSQLITTRQGFVGPVVAWHFSVPVVPKIELA